MDWGWLALGGLQQLGVHAVQHTRGAKGHGGRVAGALEALAGRLDALDLHGLVIQERGE